MPDLVFIADRVKAEIREHASYFEQPEFRNGLYRVMRIPKRTGGFRILHEPQPWLKSIQADLAKLLTYFDSFSASLAYKSRGRGGGDVPGRINSFIDRMRSVLKVDIKDFFPSITPNLVMKMTVCNKGVAGYLQGQGFAVPLVDLVTLTTGLPQGAPTSPVISNLVMRDFDHKMAIYCRFRGMHYIRYADDIMVATACESRANRTQQLLEALKFIRRALYHKGMQINVKKTRIMDKESTSVHILGMVCNERVGLGNQKRKQLRGWANKLAFNSSDEEFQQEIGKFFGYMAYFYHCDSIGYNKLHQKFVIPIGEKYRRIFRVNRVPWPRTREERAHISAERAEQTRRIIMDRLGTRRNTIAEGLRIHQAVQDDLQF